MQLLEGEFADFGHLDVGQHVGHGGFELVGGVLGEAALDIVGGVGFGQHVVEGFGKPGHLVAGFGHLDGGGQVVDVGALDLLAEDGHGAEGRAYDEPGEHRAQEDERAHDDKADEGEAAAAQRPEAGLQLAEGEGLAQVVVGALVQAEDSVVDVVAGGEDQDFDRLAVLADQAQDFEAVQAGEVEVSKMMAS